MRSIYNLCKLACIVAVLAISVNASAQSKSKDEQAIQDVMKREVEYWNAGNIEAYVDLYAPDDSVRMLWSTGSCYGKDSILAFYRKYWPKEKMGKLNFTEVKIERISDQYYFTQGFFHVLRDDGKTVNGRFSGLMKKINGKWYIYTDHSG